MTRMKRINNHEANHREQTLGRRQHVNNNNNMHNGGGENIQACELIVSNNESFHFEIDNRYLNNNEEYSHGYLLLGLLLGSYSQPVNNANARNGTKSDIDVCSGYVCVCVCVRVLEYAHTLCV